MKSFLLSILLFLFIAPFRSFAQLTLTPNPVIVENVDISLSEVIAEGVIKNGFEEARDFVWTRKITLLSEGWTTAVCDKNTCYLTTTETAEFNLAAGEENTMNVYIYPENIEGMAIVEVTVTDKNDEEISVTGSYFFNAEPSNTSSLKNAPIKVYPNPSNGLFRVANGSSLDQIEVFSVTGQMVLQFKATEDSWYNIESLPKGSYVLRLVDQLQQTIDTRLLQRM